MPEKPSKLKIRESFESFLVDNPFQLENVEWILGLNSFEVYSSAFNVGEKKEKIFWR